MAGVTGDLGVEDEERGLQLGNMGSDALTVLFQKVTALRFRADAALPHGCIMQHFPDRHSGRSQTAKKFDPDQD